MPTIRPCIRKDGRQAGTRSTVGQPSFDRSARHPYTLATAARSRGRELSNRDFRNIRPLPERTDSLLSPPEFEAALEGLAENIAQRVDSDTDLLLVGIRRRGDVIAERLADLLEPLRGARPDTGSLDITLYRDDFNQVGPLPLVGGSELPGPIADRHVVVVDDVLFTGRTIRAALNELADFGRARRVELCVLIDRGGRELPIQADYVGRRVEVPEGMEVAVSVPPLDPEASVRFVPLDEPPLGQDG